MVTFVPPDSYSEALFQAHSDLRAWTAIRADWKRTVSSTIAQDALDEMMRHRDATIKSLRNTDASARLAAIALVGEYWPQSERFVDDALRLAFEDSVPGIRGAALFAVFLHKHFIIDATGFLTQLLNDLFPPLPPHAAEERRCALRAQKLYVEEVWLRRRRSMAREYSAAMMASRESAESFLNHSEPQLRQAALLCLKYDWEPDAAYQQHCERLLLEDSDVRVRSLALACLAECCRGTDHVRIGRLFASLVREESVATSLRCTAYRALFTLRGMPPESVLQVATSKFRFPEEVDWALVDSFL